MATHFKRGQHFIIKDVRTPYPASNVRFNYKNLNYKKPVKSVHILKIVVKIMNRAMRQGTDIGDCTADESLVCKM
jgi:hypothetical protein